MAAHQITDIDGELADLLRKHFAKDGRIDNIKVDGCILPKRYKQFADEIENFQVRDDDVWVCAFPKTGTTWTQEMVWSIANDLDFERGKLPIDKRFPWVENLIMLAPAEVERQDTPNTRNNSISYAREMPSPRFIKSHLPHHLLPRQLRTGEKKPKVVYVVRNAKDTCISFYQFSKLIHGFDGSFQDFATLFLQDTVYFAPFWKHALSFWNERNNHKMLILHYEDMKKDLPSVIRKTAEFLGKNLTNEQVSMLAEHLSFSSMKVNPAVNYEGLISGVQKALQVNRDGVFMRSGTTGQWKTTMTPELIKQFDDKTREHWDGTDFPL